jgi:hypothetical protein
MDDHGRRLPLKIIFRSLQVGAAIVVGAALGFAGPALRVVALNAILHLPPQWQVIEDAGPAGLALQTPDGARVEIVVWRPYAQPPSASSAAREHRILLERSCAFEVVREREVALPWGGRGVAVSGLARAGNSLWQGAYQVFLLEDGRACVLGCFVAGGEGEERARQLLAVLGEALEMPGHGQPLLASSRPQVLSAAGAGPALPLTLAALPTRASHPELGPRLAWARLTLLPSAANLTGLGLPASLHPLTAALCSRPAAAPAVESGSAVPELVASSRRPLAGEAMQPAYLPGCAEIAAGLRVSWPERAERPAVVSGPLPELAAAPGAQGSLPPVQLAAAAALSSTVTGASGARPALNSRPDVMCFVGRAAPALAAQPTGTGPALAPLTSLSESGVRLALDSRPATMRLASGPPPSVRPQPSEPRPLVAWAPGEVLSSGRRGWKLSYPATAPVVAEAVPARIAEAPRVQPLLQGGESGGGAARPAKPTRALMQVSSTRPYASAQTSAALPAAAKPAAPSSSPFSLTSRPARQLALVPTVGPLQGAGPAWAAASVGTRPAPLLARTAAVGGAALVGEVGGARRSAPARLAVAAASVAAGLQPQPSPGAIPAGALQLDLAAPALTPPPRTARPAGWVRDFETGMLCLPIPAGWGVEVHVQAGPSGPAIAVEGTAAADPSARFWWMQPAWPLYREFSQLMRALGYREWQTYGDARTGDRFIVAARRAPRRYLEDVVLANPAGGWLGWQMLDAQPSDRAGALLVGGEGLVAHVSGSTGRGACEGWYAVAVGQVRGQPDYVWAGAWLGAQGRAGDPSALKALAAVLRGAMVASGPLAEPLAAFVAAARDALEDLLQAGGLESAGRGGPD